MLKLLLSHWQAHREPPPFILTDDPLYCTHFSTARLPEVYSVNRINPIFEDDNEEQFYVLHKRSASEEQRESETRSSDDTGYSSGQRKCNSSVVDLTDVGSFDHQMSSDSDEPPEALVVSADVHRVSFPDDVIVLSSDRNSYSTGSVSSHRSIGTESSLSEQPFDSLTESNYTEFSNVLDHSEGDRNSLSMEGHHGVNTEVKRPLTNGRVGPVREKIQRLLEHGTRKVLDNYHSEYKDSSRGLDVGREQHMVNRSRQDLMRSLTRALNNKVPKTTDNLKSTVNDVSMVTRTDSSSGKSGTVIPPPPPPPKSNSPDVQSSQSSGVTRQDESSLSSSGGSSGSQAKKHRHRHRHRHHHEKIHEQDHNAMHPNDHNSRDNPRLCKVCDEAHKPLNLHQFLPGHWSYDNIYLPQLPRMCYHCLHHQVLPMTEDEIFHPMYYNKRGKVRHSWAPHSTNFNDPIRHPRDQSRLKSLTKSGGDRRCSPDGSSHEITEEEEEKEMKLTRPPEVRDSIPERRSLRVPKRCKCEDCLSAALDNETLPHIVPIQPCTCYLPHRRVKFASDTDLTRHSHDIENGFVKDKGDQPTFGNTHSSGALTNGHFPLKKILDNKGDPGTAKSAQPTLNRGQKEPIKVDELYRSYPMSFQEWETHFRRKFLRKRRKRALNMIGMAIGIVLVVGVAIAMTFIFLRLKRPT